MRSGPGIVQITPERRTGARSWAARSTRIAATVIAARARGLWLRAVREHSSPGQIGCSVGVGAFAAFTPLFGLHLGAAWVLATVLRLNRLWAMIGSRLSATPILLASGFVEIEAGHHFRTGRWAQIAVREVTSHGHELIADWVLGSLLVGVPTAAAIGGVAYLVARRWHASRPHMPEAPRPRTSGSPPSAHAVRMP